jgi:hypothetical protein
MDLALIEKENLMRQLSFIMRSGISTAMLLIAPLGHAEGTAEPAVEPKAKEVLQKMASYFETAEAISFKANASTEDVSSTLQKLQYDTSIEGVIQRPNKVYFKKSGHEQASLWYDGQTATILDQKTKRYAKFSVGGDLSDLIAKLDKLGIETPFAGLFDKNILKQIDDHVFKGDDYGVVPFDGIETNHLAFRQDAVDWQLWTDLATGAPKKVIITSKMLATAPQHMLVFKEVTRNPPSITPAMFQVQLPSDATEVPIQGEEAESFRNSNW